MAQVASVGWVAWRSGPLGRLAAVDRQPDRRPSVQADRRRAEIALFEANLGQRPRLARFDGQSAVERKFLLSRGGVVEEHRDGAVCVARPAAGALHVSFKQRNLFDVAVLWRRQPILEEISRSRRDLCLEQNVNVVPIVTERQGLVGGGTRLMRPGRDAPVDHSDGQAIGDLWSVERVGDGGWRMEDGGWWI